MPRPSCRVGTLSWWSNLFSFFTSFAPEGLSEMRGATVRREDPGSIGHRRLMANMLPVAASQICDPIAMFILMVAHDRLLHIEEGTFGA